MNEEEREYFLNRFRGNEDCDLQSLIGMEIEEEEEQTLIGFCVLGGIFGEGIDLQKGQPHRCDRSRNRTATGRL